MIQVDYYQQSWFNHLFAIVFFIFLAKSKRYISCFFKLMGESPPLHRGKLGNFMGKSENPRTLCLKEREVQQKLWNFSSQNLVNVAWSFAKAGLFLNEKLFAGTFAGLQSGIFVFEEAAVNDFGWNWQCLNALVLTVQWFVLMIFVCWQVMVARRSFFEELGQCAAQLAPDFNPQNCSNAVGGLKVLTSDMSIWWIHGAFI